jgi:metal-responsive CopG/Arc/MetJ family transcriptional regulator
MPKTKVAITLDAALLRRLDALVGARRFRNRSQAIESAVSEKLERYGRTRLAAECEKLDPREERAWAELGLADDTESWPAY